jgi:phenylalanyl-tRNA synthetase alpha chain
LEETLDALKARALRELAEAGSEPLLLQVKARYLGKKGELTARMKGLAQLPPEERRLAGQQLNVLKDELEAAFSDRAAGLRQIGLTRLETNRPDISLPGRPLAAGHVHPIEQVLEAMEDIFLGLGFSIEEGPDVEDDFHNFEALNMPPGHPAREMQDTFYLTSNLLLRTQTSAAQVHTMLAQEPPLRIISPGAVYRSDMDISHSPMFHQVEGLMVDDRVSMTDLKGVLLEFARRMFGPETGVRFRASFFPFTEPSAEIDISCFICYGQGCRTCKHSGWIEIGGCGMVNPEVFRKLERPEYDPARIRGFAFGLGVERITMLKLGIADIRTLFENDVRLLHQF